MPASPFSAGVHLTKREAFEACQALADADRVLVAADGLAEARALGDLFELLEDRLTTASGRLTAGAGPGSGCRRQDGRG